MEFLNDYWGLNDDITIDEIALRAVAMFCIALVMVRILGMRPFGKGNAYDIIIAFLIGGILSRGVVGATPFFSSIAGAITIMIIHKVIGKFSVRSARFDRVVNGTKLLLYQNGQLLFDNMKKVDVTESNIFEELRLQLQFDSLEKVKEVYMEKTGEISFILLEKQPK